MKFQNLLVEDDLKTHLAEKNQPTYLYQEKDNLTKDQKIGK